MRSRGSEELPADSPPPSPDPDPEPVENREPVPEPIVELQTNVHTKVHTTTAFTFKNLLRHYAKGALTPRDFLCDYEPSCGPSFEALACREPRAGARAGAGAS